MSNSNLQKYALIAEIFGAIAIVVSLVFVGVEIRNNTEATKIAMREAINQKDLDYLSLRLDSAVLAQAHAKFESGEALSVSEEYQLMHQEYINFVSFEHSYYQYLKGALESDQWERHENIVRLQIQEDPHARRMWERKQYTFTPEFRAVVSAFAPGLESNHEKSNDSE